MPTKLKHLSCVAEAAPFLGWQESGVLTRGRKRREGKMKVVYLPAPGKGSESSAREREGEGPF